MDGWFLAKRIPRLGEAVAGALVTALSLGAVAWMTTASREANSESGPGTPPSHAVASPAPNSPSNGYLLVVVSSDEAATELRGMLQAESRVRAIAREPQRPAGVVIANDDGEFAALLATTNNDGAFSTQPLLHVIDLRRPV